MVREKFVSYEEQLKKEEELVKNETFKDKVANFVYHHKSGLIIAAVLIVICVFMFIL